jgi:hypothetical protein
MNTQLVVGLLALSVFCARAKDGHWNPKNSTVVTATPRSGSSTGSKTFYSYSYKSPGTATQRPTTDLSDYAHKGAARIDSYKSSSSYSKISKSPSVASGLNTAQGKANTAINRAKTSPVANAALQATLQSVLQK